MLLSAHRPSSYTSEEFEVRVWQLLGDDALRLRDVFSRTMSLALNVDRSKPLSDIPHQHDGTEIAHVVGEATRSIVHKVRFVEPNDLPEEMALWPTRGSLWGMDTMVGTYLALHNAGNTRLTELTTLVEGYIAHRAATGILRNFDGTSPEIRHMLNGTFGWTAGNAVMNQLALRLAGEDALAALVDPLTMLMASVPFMARHPLRPNELFVLIRKY